MDEGGNEGPAFRINVPAEKLVGVKPSSRHALSLLCRAAKSVPLSSPRGTEDMSQYPANTERKFGTLVWVGTNGILIHFPCTFNLDEELVSLHIF